MNDARSRRWQLTENNPEYTKKECAERISCIAKTRYIISCEETGETGTKHVHAFMIFENAIRLTSIKAKFPRAHLEVCEGSNVENRVYISKDDSEPFECGEMPLTTQREKKTDFAKEVIDLIRGGNDLGVIMTEYPELCDYVVKHYRSLKEIANDFGLKTRY